MWTLIGCTTRLVCIARVDILWSQGHRQPLKTPCQGFGERIIKNGCTVSYYFDPEEIAVVQILKLTDQVKQKQKTSPTFPK